jgi:hypothetical protein
MKRTSLAALGLAAGSLLVPATAHADWTTDEARFIVWARDNLSYADIPGGRYATDADVLASGYKTCSAFDAGSDIFSAGQAAYPGASALSNGAVEFVMLATQYLCPQHSKLFAQW